MNWKKALLLGCAGVFVVCSGAIALLLVSVTGAIRSSEPYRVGLEAARTSPEVAEALGEPIEPGFLASGSISVSGGSGEADLSVPVSGPKGKGTVYVDATKVAGAWEYDRIVVEVGDERIDVTDRAAP